MKLAQLSDLHFGSKTLEEAQRCTEHAVDAALARGAECAVISGDATDHALAAHAPALTSLARLVRRLADHLPVLMLQGTYSHEPPGTLNVFRLLGGRFPIFVADRIGQVALTGDGRWLQSEGFRWQDASLPAGTAALFSCLPAVNKANVAAAVGAREADWVVADHVAAVLGGFGLVNQQARAAGMPTIGVSHGTVGGCVTEHGVPMAGLDHEFSAAALFCAEASAFMLGHIHKHQVWRDGHRRVAYAGSIGRFTYGEKGDKGFLLWNVEAEGATCELVPTPAQRTVEVEFNGVPDADALARLAAEVEGARVRVRWTVGKEQRDRVDDLAIENLLTHAGAVDVKLEGRVLPTIRSRSAGIAGAVSVAERLARWAELNDADPAALQACLDTLHSRGTEAIAADVLASTAGDAQTAAPVAEDGIREEVACAR